MARTSSPTWKRWTTSPNKTWWHLCQSPSLSSQPYQGRQPHNFDPIDTSTNDLVSPVTKTRAVALDDSDSDEENEIESNLNLIPDAQTDNSATEIQARVPENKINPNSNALTHEDIMDSPSQEIPKIVEPE